MDWLNHLFFYDDKFLGIQWSVWKVVGWLGNLIFFSRVAVQWYVAEKKKQVVVPAAFWWLSLVGSLLLLIYSLKVKNSVFIFAYAFTWIPYIRNLIIHQRHTNARQLCPDCGVHAPPSANFCAECGSRLAPQPAKAS
jgi:lipid-A-disaccharide synthase-like uncharacterized protein